MSLSVVVGVGVVVATIIVVSQLVDRQKHAGLRHFLMAIVLPLLLLIPAATMLEQDSCQPFQANVTTVNHFNGSNIINSTVHYDYEDICFAHGNGSRIFMRVLITVNFLYVLYLLAMYLGDVLNWLRNIGRKI